MWNCFGSKKTACGGHFRCQVSYGLFCFSRPVDRSRSSIGLSYPSAVMINSINGQRKSKKSSAISWSLPRDTAPGGFIVHPAVSLCTAPQRALWALKTFVRIFAMLWDLAQTRRLRSIFLALVLCSMLLYF